MEFYIIPPLKNLSLMEQGDRFFCLAHLYVNEKNEEYREFFKQKSKEGFWITLDNGAAENSLVTESVLLEVCKELLPNEVIAPDVIGDGFTTMKNATSFYEKLVFAGIDDKVKLFFCPQGKDYEEWLTAYKFGLRERYIETIGWSKIAIPAVISDATNDELILESRQELFERLKALGRDEFGDHRFYFQKPIHLLGAGDPREFSAYKNEPYIRSSDSCFSVWAAMNGKDWSKEEFERIPTPEDYFDRKVTRGLLEITKRNTAYLKQFNS